MPSAGTEYWLVGTSEESADSRDGIYSLLKSKLQQAKLVDDTAVFEVPAKLKFGRFDDLVALLDDVQKYDAYIEGTCHRLEKMGLDVDQTAEFKVIWQRNTLTADEYLKKFVWDEAKYSNLRLLRQNVELIVNGVQKLDDEIRVKAAQFQDLKNQLATSARNTNQTLAARDLVDVLRPEIVGNDSPFVYSERLTTVVCVCPHAESAKFEANYWKWNDKVVPGSLKKIDVDVANSNVAEDVYTVCLFRKSVGEYKDACRRESKCTVRDFKYDPTAFEKLNLKRMTLEADRQQTESMLTRICIAAFSECFVSLVHMKAVKMYIEGQLRFGANSRLNSFVLQLPPKYKEQKIRDVLNGILVNKNTLGQSYFTQKTENDDETLFPYLQLNIIPFAVYNSP